MAVVTITDTTVDGQGTPPDAPTGLTTETEWDGVRLHWTNPTQRDVDYIEIWRATVNNRASATMVAQVKGNDYVDHSLETGTRYYWLRAISTTGVYSTNYHPTSATAGVSGIPDQVEITSPANNQVLQFDTTTNSFINTNLRHNTRLKGEMQASTDDSYVFPPQTLITVSDNNGYSASSSLAGSAGYGANMTYTHYFGDTLAGTNTTTALQFKTANGNSTTGTVPFTGISGVAPSAVQNTNTMGTINFNGYCTTGFSNEVGTTNQGGGINAIHGIQIQGYAVENFSDSTLTLTSSNVTAVASSFRATIASPSVTGTKGQISFTSTSPVIGNAVRVTGTLTGNATGIVSGQTYYIIATNGTTTAQLSATPGGLPIDTTGSTLTGLTLTRCGVTFTLSGMTYVPFGRGAKVTVSGITNVTDGTYPVFGTPTSTSFNLGIPHTVAPTVSGSQSFSCLTTYQGSALRARALPLATPANLQNRLEIIDHSPATATYRADTFNIAGGTYGNTSTTRLSVDSTKVSASLPVVFPSYTTTTRNALTPAAGWVIFNTTTVKLECYDGTAWQALF